MNVSCSDSYDAQIANVAFSQKGLHFTDDSRVAIGSMGPFGAGEMISCALRFKTFSSRDMVLSFYGGKFGKSKTKDVFLLTLQNGNPILYFGKKTFLAPRISLSLDDGSWHSIIITMPSKSCLYSEMKMIINGEEVETELNGQDKHIFFITSGHVSLGGWGYSHTGFGVKKLFGHIENYRGRISNFQVWHGKSINENDVLSVIENYEHQTESSSTAPPSSNDSNLNFSGPPPDNAAYGSRNVVPAICVSVIYWVLL